MLISVFRGRLYPYWERFSDRMIDHFSRGVFGVERLCTCTFTPEGDFSIPSSPGLAKSLQ